MATEFGRFVGAIDRQTVRRGMSLEPRLTHIAVSSNNQEITISRRVRRSPRRGTRTAAREGPRLHLRVFNQDHGVFAVAQRTIKRLTVDARSGPYDEELRESTTP